MPESPNVFDEVFALLTPERLLQDPRATGEGVRVCLLDSGVERAPLEEKFRRRGQLRRAGEEGCYKDVLICPAAHNDHPLTRSYAAVFAPPLISVDQRLSDD